MTPNGVKRSVWFDRSVREGECQPHCGRLSFPSTTVALALAREFDLYQLDIAICFVSPDDRILLILLLMSLIYFSVYPSSLCAAIFRKLSIPTLFIIIFHSWFSGQAQGR